MPTNFYFQSGNTSGTTAEQRLVEDLIIECLKIYGHDVYYVPRTLVNRDTIFDEDALSQFTQAYPLEMYLENVEGFEGEGELFTKFGLEIRDQATFIVAQRRWDELVQTSGGEFQSDARPVEGDLIYFEKTKSLFEIKYVEFQNPFYQVGKLYTYKLVCELFEYSSEILDTGISDIDQIEEGNSQDALLFQVLLETGDALLTETNEAIILDEFATQKSNVNTDNADIFEFNEANDILDFSEVNPFGEIGGN